MNLGSIQMKTMENNYKEIIPAIGEDIYRDGLVDTPKCAANAKGFLTQGYQQNIELYSMCEHHRLQKLIGKARNAVVGTV
jgi:GTP cyclohydrolase I